MRYIVDGYNLMHALGLVATGAAEPAFHAARVRYLDWLAQKVLHKPSASCRVVFDAQRSKRDLGSSTHRGLIVQYSHRITADDLIENLLAVEKVFAELYVVSNDNRLKTAAIRRGAVAMSCEAFVDWLELPPEWTSPPSASEQEKPELDPVAEVEQLYEIFTTTPPTKRGRPPRV